MIGKKSGFEDNPILIASVALVHFPEAEVGRGEILGESLLIKVMGLEANRESGARSGGGDSFNKGLKGKGNVKPYVNRIDALTTFPFKRLCDK